MSGKLNRAAQEWMERNPNAYTLFDKFALQMVNSGQKFGAKLVAERIRWECRLRKIGQWKWNNNYTKYVALRWAENNPIFAHYLEFRERSKPQEQ